MCKKLKEAYYIMPEIGKPNELHIGRRYESLPTRICQELSRGRYLKFGNALRHSRALELVFYFVNSHIAVCFCLNIIRFLSISLEASNETALVNFFF